MANYNSKITSEQKTLVASLLSKGFSVVFLASLTKLTRARFYQVFNDQIKQGRASGNRLEAKVIELALTQDNFLVELTQEIKQVKEQLIKVGLKNVQ